MAWLLIPSSLLVAWLIWNSITLCSNYVRARKIGLPIAVSPIYPLSPIWALFHNRHLPVLRRLPFNIGVRHSYFGWSFDDKYRLHEELGDAFLSVNPGQIELFVAGADAIEDIASRRKEFDKPVILYKPLELFGKNVDTVVGEEWQRQRKITTPPFNERNNSLVWKESTRQAQEMLESWLESSPQSITNTADDVATLALNVLTSAGFGQSYSFKSGMGTVPAGHTISYRDALRAILYNIIVVFLFPQDFLDIPLAPKRLRTVGVAVKEFRLYMTEIVDQERQLIKKRDPGNYNLASSLIRASDQSKEHALTDDEILGNIFVYSFAGHETTANTLTYLIYLLSINPTYQDWLSEEIDHVLGQGPSPILPFYEEIYPRLKRCLATVYETLRLYSPVTAIPKYTADAAQPLNINGKLHVIPPRTWVSLNSIAVQTNPKYWGSDSLAWRPDRWIEPPTPTTSRVETFKNPPVKGAFVAWSAGGRICPGMKFAQVELVGVLATLFGHWKVRPAFLKGESVEQARTRVMGVIEDSGVTVTLQMRRAKSVGLVWTKR